MRSERIYASPWVGLRRDLVRRPDGLTGEHHVVEIPDAVAVLPLTSAGEIVLVGQYRYAHGLTHWEIPAGRLHAGETPEAGAERELLEETGHRAARLDPLPGFYPINGISAHRAHVFVARDCRRVAEPSLDVLEQIVVRAFPRAEVEALLDAGRLTDAFTALPLLVWLRRERG